MGHLFLIVYNTPLSWLTMDNYVAKYGSLWCSTIPVLHIESRGGYRLRLQSYPRHVPGSMKVTLYNDAPVACRWMAHADSPSQSICPLEGVNRLSSVKLPIPVHWRRSHNQNGFRPMLRLKYISLMTKQYRYSGVYPLANLNVANISRAVAWNGTFK